ncbi:PASTA domain-containing protein [Actinoplanes sp. KI2]|uniref:PASTA domain-containing protein n=1 Tax=Actinoplanes sp. KI2 TaxID=2983315 RepID=UPI0021D57D84|nr:PASTA domain-containing protein [Actinoplanes sp. KI2]MCU7729772.1 PASTA domain-containing protein [Actinoplanes sp. KI2]
MSEESDETRRVPPADATLPGKPLDDTVADGAPPVPASDDTVVDGAPPVPASDDTVVDGAPPVPASSNDDWSVWSGRAEVRSPRPGPSMYDTDWSDGPHPPTPGQRDRWWMPIVVGIVVLLLLGVLAWAIYVIVQNSSEQPSPVTTTPPTTVATTAASSPAPSTAPSSPPSTEPSTIPTTTATTQEPTAAVTVPALRGLPLAEARVALSRTGLPYRVLYRNSTAAPGTVIDSDPAEGQEVPPDTRVTIVVAQQSDATTTPAGTATATR